jgi:hypothetical protein
VQARECPCNRLSNGSGAQREHRAPGTERFAVGGLHAAVHPRERTSCAEPSSVFGFVPADQCCVVVAGGSPSKGKPDARSCAWRFAGLAVAGVRTCLHLPAVLTMPANRASPPRCRQPRSHLPGDSSIALTAVAEQRHRFARSSVLLREYGKKWIALERQTGCGTPAGCRLPLSTAKAGPSVSRARLGLVSWRCRACRSRLCLSELALGGIDDTGSVLV